MDITAMVAEVRRYEEEFWVERTIIDGANRQAVEEMRARHGVQLEAAEKRDKFDFIAMMNDDFVQGYILLAAGYACDDLRAEARKLVKDKDALRRGKQAEQPGLANHCLDSALYNWRYCYPYLAEKLPEVPEKGTVAEAEAVAVALEREERATWEATQQTKEAETDWAAFGG